MTEKGRATLPSGPGVQYLTNKSTHVYERSINEGAYRLKVAVNAFSRIIVSINEIAVTVLAEDGLEAVWHELILAGAFGPAVDQHVRFKLINNLSFMHKDALTWLENMQRQARSQRGAKYYPQKQETRVKLYE